MLEHECYVVSAPDTYKPCMKVEKCLNHTEVQRPHIHSEWRAVEFQNEDFEGYVEFTFLVEQKHVLTIMFLTLFYTILIFISSEKH